MGITKEQIKKALQNSGYLLEDRVNQVLKKNSWSTTPNARFKDLRTGVEREVDVVAYKYLPKYLEHIKKEDDVISKIMGKEREKLLVE